MCVSLYESLDFHGLWFFFKLYSPLSFLQLKTFTRYQQNRRGRKVVWGGSEEKNNNNDKNLFTVKSGSPSFEYESLLSETEDKVSPVTVSL